MGDLAKVSPEEIRLMSIQGTKVRLLLNDSRLLEHIYPSEEALDRDLRDWAARARFSLPELIRTKSENDIAGFGP